MRECGIYAACMPQVGRYVAVWKICRVHTASMHEATSVYRCIGMHSCVLLVSTCRCAGFCEFKGNILHKYLQA